MDGRNRRENKYSETRRSIDGSDDYYNLWLQALIELISNKGITDAEAILDVQNRWADAFRNAPHGKPIKI